MTAPVRSRGKNVPAALRRFLPPVPRRTVRLRLTLVYSSLFLLSGAGLLAITYLLVARRAPVTGVELHHPAGSGPGTSFQACPQAGNGAAAGSPPLSACRAFLRSRAAQQRAQELHQLLTESGIALAIMTVASIALGWLTAGRLLRPLRAITAAARRISASDLHERLALAGPADELKELGDTFDGLLGRLAASFDAQRQFIANASHELRTPLTRQRTLLEIALGDPDATAGTLRAACERALATGAEQERLIEALLTLARSERGLDKQERVDLRSIAGEALLIRRRDASSLGLRVEAALGEAATWGDWRLAERLVANLLDNAVRYNVTDGWIKVETATRAGHAVFAVANSGPEIPHAVVDRLFQPFQRLDTGRTGTRGGLGLGLAIVHAIAATHEAALTADPQPDGGLAVEVDFPGLGRPAGPPAAASHPR